MGSHSGSRSQRARTHFSGHSRGVRSRSLISRPSGMNGVFSYGENTPFFFGWSRLIQIAKCFRRKGKRVRIYFGTYPSALDGQLPEGIWQGNLNRENGTIEDLSQLVEVST